MSSSASVNVSSEPSQTIAVYQNQVQQLDTINDEFNRIYTFFFSQNIQDSPLDMQCKNLLFTWKKIIEKCSRLLVQTAGVSGKQCLLMLDIYLDYLKRVYLKLHIATLDTSHGAAGENLITYNVFATMMLRLCSQLMVWVGTQITDENNTDFLDNNQLTAMVRAVIPTHIIKAPIYRVASLYDVLGYDLFDESLTIAQEYLDLVIAYERNRYVQDSNMQDELVAKADMLVNLLYEKTEKNDNNELKRMVLTAFMNNVWHIKNALAFAQQLERCTTQTPEMASSLMQHHRIIQSPFFLQMYMHMSQVERVIVDTYCGLVDHFFVHDRDKVSALFFYELEKTSTDLYRIKTHYAGGWLKWLWYGTLPVVDVITDMIAVLESLKKPRAGFFSMMNDIVSGNWLNGIKKIVKTDSGDYILEYANQLLGKRKFSDVKSATLYALLYASPFLLTKLIKYIFPSLSGDLQEKAASLLDDKTQTGNEGQDVIAFANKNPELIKQMCDRNPEIIDLLVQSLKQHAVIAAKE